MNRKAAIDRLHKAFEKLKIGEQPDPPPPLIDQACALASRMGSAQYLVAAALADLGDDSALMELAPVVGRRAAS